MKNQSLSQAASRFLRCHFAAFYEAHPPRLPHRAANREFGAWHWRPDGTAYLHRHMQVRHPADLEALLRDGPHSILSSAAYYRHPTAQMDAKGWLGAVLAFDVDADRLRQVQARLRDGPVPLAEQLGLAKHAARRIVTVLTTDLGIAPKHIEVAFSGGRGYHVRVLDPEVLAADGAMRREVCNYVTGHGGQTDEPVTVDTTRLLRLPGSLHGGSGFQCQTVGLEELDAFDPLRDAIPFGHEVTSVRGLRSAEVTLDGQLEQIRAGQDAVLPLRHAVFLVARGAAEPTGEGGPG
jgi:DNA primase catalytic subunit